QVEQRGLARAVGADQADDLAGAERRRDVVGDHDAAEALAQAGDLEHGRHGARTAGRSSSASIGGTVARRGWRFAPTNPSGRRNRNTSTRPVKIMPCSGPVTDDGRCRKLIAWGRNCSSSAPSAGPHTVRTPPTTTMVRIAAEYSRSNCSGDTNRK